MVLAFCAHRDFTKQRGRNWGSARGLETRSPQKNELARRMAQEEGQRHEREQESIVPNGVGCL